jgi:general secretion pathway protein G
MMRKTGRRGNERGLTLIELVSCSAIILVLASVAIPVANTWVKRRKELELRQALREIRTAIDRFQWDVEHIQSMGQKLNGTNEEKFPEKLEWLYQGFDIGDLPGTKVKYLRRLPLDPLTGKADWVTRSSRDKPGSFGTDGMNIFDVHSKSEAVALDGTPYAQW